MSRFTEEHKAAMAESHAQNRAVSSYLAALEQQKERSDKPVDIEKLTNQRNEAAENARTETSPLKRLDFIQERMSLDRQIRAEERRIAAPVVNLQDAEDEFVRYAAAFSERKGISRSAWRSVGVPPQVLARANVHS